MRTIVAVILMFAAAPAALAQSYSFSGQIGYLHEWEMTGNLAKTVTRLGADYSGAMTLRHVGLCSVNGVEEKAGVVQLKVSAARLEGTLTMADDNCRIVASASSSYQGLLSCRNGQGVPQDYVQAHVWFSLAALLASEKEDRDGAAKARDLLSSEMSTAQVTEAEKLAREWWPKPER
jgi:hypothetical protein